MGFNKIAQALSVTLILAGVSFAYAQNAGTHELRASTATLNGPTSVPYGWVDFCGREPQECNQPALPAVDLDLTPAVWRMLNKVNLHVNRTIVPISNFDHWGTLLDHWDYPKDGKGDCKIYALWKRKILMDAGLPRQALLMTIVRDLNGEGHTILTVKTDRGEFILDNLRDDIRPWDATGYHFLKRQSQQNPNVWVGIAQEAKVSSLN
ncbi:transglutaminase-like cysteine peptidase [uncultured Methylovirgula sp.]|uniref:transglutaminase-like cysteine peptidase n=1 Tax=uncultured Methylovirgula sp. TaxID=1285960 RepID=UPI002613A457|nr:transglutaminase-like cysteine peptidase [uncultured Methylovirgula sp.]